MRKNTKIFAIFLLMITSIVITTFSVPAVQAKSDTDVRYLPIIMYHQILKSRNGAYIVSPKQLENDIVALKEQGYTTVLLREVIDFVNGSCSLPKKPIIITFDDGHYNNMFYGDEILRKQNAKCVFSIIGAFSEYSATSGDSDNANYSHLTWKEIATLASNPNYEIGNHTYNMHKLKPRFGVTRMKGESVDTYLTTVGADISRMQQCLKTKSNVDCYIFAYPFGALDKDCKKILISMGFKTMLNCTEGVNKIERGNMETLYSLKRYNRDGKYSTSTLLNKIAQGEKKLKERELKAS